VFFYGYGDKFRRDWMKTMVGEASRLAPDSTSRSAGSTSREIPARRGRSATSVQSLRSRDLGGDGSTST
jgi:hypothetical protein